MIVKRRYPNYFSGFEETEYNFKTVDELKEIDFIKGFMESPGFTKLSIAKSTVNISYSHLMAEYNNDGKHTWWAIAYFPDGYGDLELDDFVPTIKELPKPELKEVARYKPPSYDTLDSFLNHVDKG